MKIYHEEPKVRVTLESTSIDEITLMIKGIDFARKIMGAVDKINSDILSNADGEVLYSATEVKDILESLLPKKLFTQEILNDLI
jgi:hypothetical protein